jgi:hypothetical protein
VIVLPRLDELSLLPCVLGVFVFPLYITLCTLLLHQHHVSSCLCTADKIASLYGGFY